MPSASARGCSDCCASLAVSFRSAGSHTCVTSHVMFRCRTYRCVIDEQGTQLRIPSFMWVGSLPSQQIHASREDYHSTAEPHLLSQGYVGASCGPDRPHRCLRHPPSPRKPSVALRSRHLGASRCC